MYITTNLLYISLRIPTICDTAYKSSKTTGPYGFAMTKFLL